MKIWPLLDRVYAVLAVAAALVALFFRRAGAANRACADSAARGNGRMALTGAKWWRSDNGLMFSLVVMYPIALKA